MKRVNLLKNKKGTNKGITLIALVITIIVLLILAAVSIATLTGENGILTKAGTAKEDTQRASAIEQAKVDILAWQTEKLGKNEDATLNDSIIQTQILEGKDYVKDGNPGPSSFITAEGEHEISYSELYKKSEKVIVDGVTIPKGFYHVAGTTKNAGLVISDVEGDDLDNSKGGNQFVWVPVEEGEFKRSDWYNWNGTDEPTDLTDSTTYIENAENDPTGKYAEMVSSVETNHGFYIGRFEAGNEGGTLNYNEKTYTGTWEGNSTLVVKKDKTVWNYIPWGTSMTEIGTEGAVYRSLNFVKNTYTDKGKEVGVKSTLVYGIQWDAVMRWLSKDEDLKGYIKNSEGKGNYSDDDATNNPAKTGAVDTYQMKNIYDIAGNVWEWTMEAYSTDYRVFRGGCYYGGSDIPVSIRGSDFPSGSDDFVGFRVALYL